MDTIMWGTANKLALLYCISVFTEKLGKRNRTVLLSRLLNLTVMGH